MSLKLNSINNFPTLEEFLTVEKTIKKYDGELKKTMLWKKLPKKISYKKYKTIIDYLLKEKKISLDSEGKLGWIYYPNTTKYFLKNIKI